VCVWILQLEKAVSAAEESLVSSHFGVEGRCGHRFAKLLKQKRGCWLVSNVVVGVVITAVSHGIVAEEDSWVPAPSSLY